MICYLRLAFDSMELMLKSNITILVGFSFMILILYSFWSVTSDQQCLSPLAEGRMATFNECCISG